MGRHPQAEPRALDRAPSPRSCWEPRGRKQGSTFHLGEKSGPCGRCPGLGFCGETSGFPHPVAAESGTQGWDPNHRPLQQHGQEAKSAGPKPCQAPTAYQPDPGRVSQLLAPCHRSSPSQDHKPHHPHSPALEGTPLELGKRGPRHVKVDLSVFVPIPSWGMEQMGVEGTLGGQGHPAQAWGPASRGQRPSGIRLQGWKSSSEEGAPGRGHRPHAGSEMGTHRARQERQDRLEAPLCPWGPPRETARSGMRAAWACPPHPAGAKRAGKGPEDIAGRRAESKRAGGRHIC